MDWELLSNSEARGTWDNYLVELGDFSPFQCYAWGELKRLSGWLPQRWLAQNGRGDIVAMVQTLYRPAKLGVGIAWSSGGPVGDTSALGKEFTQALAQSVNHTYMYIRIFSTKSATGHDQEFLASHGWHRCSYKLRSGMSMWLSLSNPLDEIAKGFSKDWQKNLKRSKRYGLTVSQWIQPDVDEILGLYRSMESLKGLQPQFARAELQGILEYLSDYMVFYRCDDAKGNLVAMRGCVIITSFGWDLMAATSPAGRQMSASYQLLWEVFQRCQAAGVKRYDMMGVDPQHNPGVYHFKKGTGAKFVDYLGEWEWASYTPLRWGANWMLRYSHAALAHSRARL